MSQLDKISKKLDHKYIGPFQVEKMVGSLAVRLILPAKWRTHPTFHISTVEPYEIRNGENPNYNQILRDMNDIEADEEYDVHEIKGSIERRNKDKETRLQTNHTDVRTT